MRNVLAAALIALCAALTSAVAPAAADVFVVPSDAFSSIQMAVNNASDGDDVVVLPGTYFENVHIERGITLAAFRGEATIVAADRALPALRIHDTSAGVTVAGFAIVGGNRDDAVEVDGAGDVWLQGLEIESMGAYFSGLMVLNGAWVHARNLVVDAAGNSVTVMDAVAGVEMAPCE